LSNGTTPICTACTVYSFGGGVVLLCWPTRVTKCYPADPSGAYFNSDKVFWSSKFFCGSRRGYLTWYFTSTSPEGDWVKKSAKSVHKQKSMVFDPFRIVKTQDFSDTPSKLSKPKMKSIQNVMICAHILLFEPFWFWKWVKNNIQGKKMQIILL